MKARILFYYFAVVALVLILAAVPSHATERRDPPIVQDATQAQASSAAATHATVSGKKHARKSALKGVSSPSHTNGKAKMNSTISSPTGSSEHEGPGSSSAK